jgi:ATP-dependent DNA helicase RecG
MLTLTTKVVESLIAGGETLTVEFKSERREQISDREIYETIVCLGNSQGGVLLIGVEDDGSITGARPRHGSNTDPVRLQALILNRTVPNMNTRVSVHDVDGRLVLAIEVDPYPVVCATSDGRCLRRVNGAGGPECRPFFPHEQEGRKTDLRMLDYSAQRVDGVGWDDLNPLEIERLRQMIQSRGGGRVLFELDDKPLVQALKLVESHDGDLVPNVAGLLLLGRDRALDSLLPTHRVAFQVLDAAGNVQVNDWFFSPILRTLESIEERFNARNEEQEITVGFIRLPIPDYSPEAFREAVNNALLHRDYTQLNAVYIQFHPERVSIASPGGFLDGITLKNLLVHEPKPRNPLLAEAFRRIGLVETTGRGIDKIFDGQLRYGRPSPDYSRSDQEGVRLILRGGEASLQFAALGPVCKVRSIPEYRRW